MAVRRIDGRLLFGGQHHAHLTLDPFQYPLDPLRFRRLHQPHGNAAGGLVLLCKHPGQIDVILDCHHFSFENHVLQHICDFLRLKAKCRHRNLVVEQPKCLFLQGFPGQEQVPFGAFAIFQRPEQCSFDPHGVMKVTAVLLNNGIYAQKAESGYLAQFERTLFQDVHTGWPEILIDLERRFRRDLERGEQNQKILQHPALRIGGLNLLQFAFRDTLDFQKPFRPLLQNVQRVLSKSGYDQRSGRRSDAFDKARCQIPLHTAFGPRDDLAPLLHLKLHTILALLPFAVQFQLHRIRAGQFIAGRHEADQMVSVPAGRTGLQRHLFVSSLHTDNAEPICRVVINRPVISSFMDHFFFPSFKPPWYQLSH